MGMLRLLEEQVKEALEQREGDDRTVSLSFATGKLAYPVIARYMEKIRGKFPNIRFRGYEIRNEFLENRSPYPVSLQDRTWQDS